MHYHILALRILLLQRVPLKSPRERNAETTSDAQDRTAGDYRGPPSEFGHVRPPLRGGANPDVALRPTLSAGGGLKRSDGAILSIRIPRTISVILAAVRNE